MVREQGRARTTLQATLRRAIPGGRGRRPGRFVGAVAVVTGAGSGIGRLIATRIAAEGGRVAVWGRHAGNTEDTAASINAEHGLSQAPIARAYTVDVAQQPAVQRAAARVIRDFGHVNIVVNSAGVVSGETLGKLTPRQIRGTFGANAFGPIWVTRAFLPELGRRHRAVLATVASLAGIVGTARMTDYAASKFAAVGFMNSLRNELHHQGSHVRTLLVCPFLISTGMFAGAVSGAEQLLPVLKPQTVADAVVDAIASGRQRLILPSQALPATLLAALPPFIADAVLDALGMNRMMDRFIGRR